jgi:hypothetical protein
MSDIPVPQPKTIEICTVCEQPWAAHVKRATETGYGDDYEMETWQREITLADCVALLKIANQGPPAPVGATGATGMSAPRPELYK